MCFKCIRSVKLYSCIVLYYVNTRARTHACTRARVLRTVERAGLHARGPGQLRYNLCHWDAIPRRDAGYAHILWSVLFALVSVTVVTLYLFLGENTNSTAAASAFAHADPRIFPLIREGRVVFVSVYALGVCTSASGLWHFLDYLNI